MSSEPATANRPDHRVAVARQRREVMRGRIEAATMKVCSANPAAVPTIDEIIVAAEISRGAFYRYFNSSAEAIESVGIKLINELADAIIGLYDTLTDPLQRACVGTFLVMERAAHDPEWASFILRADLTIQKSRITDFIEHDLRMGNEAGYFTIGNVPWAAEFTMGMNLTAIRGTLVRIEAEKDLYRHEAVRFVLCALGVKSDDVARVMAWGDDYLSKSRKGARWWQVDPKEITGAVRKSRKAKA
jgi:AcrR family transcriptional regulator